MNLRVSAATMEIIHGPDKGFYRLAWDTIDKRLVWEREDAQQGEVLARQNRRSSTIWDVERKEEPRSTDSLVVVERRHGPTK